MQPMESCTSKAFPYSCQCSEWGNIYSCKALLLTSEPCLAAPIPPAPLNPAQHLLPKGNLHIHFNTVVIFFVYYNKLAGDWLPAPFLVHPCWYRKTEQSYHRLVHSLFYEGWEKRSAVNPHPTPAPDIKYIYNLDNCICSLIIHLKKKSRQTKGGEKIPTAIRYSHLWSS